MATEEKPRAFNEELYGYYDYWRNKPLESVQKELDSLNKEEEELNKQSNCSDSEGHLCIIHAEPRPDNMYKMGVIYSIHNGQINMTKEAFAETDFLEIYMKSKGVYENAKEVLKSIGIN